MRYIAPHGRPLALQRTDLDYKGHWVIAVGESGTYVGMTPDGPIMDSLADWTELVANAYAAEVGASGRPVTEYKWAPHVHCAGTFLGIGLPYTLPGAPREPEGIAGVPDGTWWAYINGMCETVKVLNGRVVWNVAMSGSPVDVYEGHQRRTRSN